MKNCQVFVLLAKVYAINNKETVAKKILQIPIKEYGGSPHESTIMMANSEIAIKSGEIKKAINILEAVLDDVYLMYMKDRRNYTKCYAQSTEAKPKAENYKVI